MPGSVVDAEDGAEKGPPISGSRRPGEARAPVSTDPETGTNLKHALAFLSTREPRQ